MPDESNAPRAAVASNGILVAPIGPVMTLGRNLQTITAALVGVVCLIIVSLSLAPWPNVLLPLVVGVLLVTASLIAAFRGVPVMRRASEAGRIRNAAAIYAFLQIEFLDGAGTVADSARRGYVLVWNDRLEIDFRRDSAGIGGPREQWSISFEEIRDVRLREPTSMTYAMPVVTLKAGEAIAFTIMPKSGSGLRGPSDSETHEVVELLRTRLTGGTR